jgi:hypothetical protein
MEAERIRADADDYAREVLLAVQGTLDQLSREVTAGLMELDTEPAPVFRDEEEEA